MNKQYGDKADPLVKVFSEFLSRVLQSIQLFRYLKNAFFTAQNITVSVGFRNVTTHRRAF